MIVYIVYNLFGVVGVYRNFDQPTDKQRLYLFSWIRDFDLK